MINIEYFDRLTEQIRLSYAHLLKMHIQYCIRNKYLKNEDNKINWDTIRPLMPPGIEKRIKKEYDTLNEREIRLCCLLLFNLPCKDIVEILPYTQKSIHSITHRIKQKTGIKKIKVGFKRFLFNKKFELGASLQD